MPAPGLPARRSADTDLATAARFWEKPGTIVSDAALIVGDGGHEARGETMAAESAHAGPLELMDLTLGAASRIAAGQEIAAGASSAGATALTKGVLRTMMLRIQLATAALLAATLGHERRPGARRPHRSGCPSRGRRADGAPCPSGRDDSEG